MLLLAAQPAQGQPPPPTAESSANWDAAQSAQCDRAIRQAEQKHHLPTGLLASIAKGESGRPVGPKGEIRAWPWAINADGTGLFPESKAAAVVWVEQQMSRHHYVDVGCLQVDLTLHPDAFASVDKAFDPTANADYAARYLLALYRGEAGRDWNVAVGLYHSHTAILAAAYRDRVAEIGARVLRGVLDPVPLYVQAIRQGTLRIRLASGRSTPINTHRQPAVHRRRLTSCEIVRELGSYLNKAARSACSIARKGGAP